jgi:hypothetical protein
MIPEAYQDLLERRLDGTATGEDLAVLEAYLACDPEARAYAEETARLADLLGSVETVAPPEALKREILGSVGSTAARPRRAGYRLADLFRARLGARTGYVFASGLAMGVLLATLLGREGWDGSRSEGLSGMMVPGSALEDLRPAGRIDLKGPGVLVTARAGSDGDRVLVAVAVTGGGRFDVTLSLPSGLVPAASRDVGRGGGEVQTTSEEIRVRQTQETEYAFVLTRTGEVSGPIVLRVASGGTVLEGSLGIEGIAPPGR